MGRLTEERCERHCHHPKKDHVALGCLYPGCLCVRTRDMGANWRRVHRRRQLDTAATEALPLRR